MVFKKVVGGWIESCWECEKKNPVEFVWKFAVCFCCAYIPLGNNTTNKKIDTSKIPLSHG